MEKIVWGPNWEEILGGEFASARKDRNFDDIQKDIYGQFENTFMMYLPRLCEHCLNPACVASCPSGSIYKREEDGIVLIDQDKCRGWRMCVSGCPYKKIYYNWQSGKAEKCTFCYPRIEAGQPTVCSETCVGRIRYLGVLLYDADRIQEAASVEHDRDLYHAQLDIFLDPHDPGVIEQARIDGIPDNWMEAARSSPVYGTLLVARHGMVLSCCPTPTRIGTRSAGRSMPRPGEGPAGWVWADVAPGRTSTRWSFDEELLPSACRRLSGPTPVRRATRTSASTSCWRRSLAWTGSSGSPARGSDRCWPTTSTATPIFATLRLYLDCGRSHEAAARALSVHRSTLKYRLQRIGEVSGHDLADPETTFNLHLAIRAWQTLTVLRSAAGSTTRSTPCSSRPPGATVGDHGLRTVAPLVSALEVAPGRSRPACSTGSIGSSKAASRRSSRS